MAEIMYLKIQNSPHSRNQVSLENGIIVFFPHSTINFTVPPRHLSIVSKPAPCLAVCAARLGFIQSPKTSYTFLTLAQAC
jgi:hypothetical protein